MFLVPALDVGNRIHALWAYLYDLAQSIGGPALLLVALADSSFLSIPEGNDILIIVLSTGQTWGVMSYYVLMTIIGSVVGCSLLYTVGRHGGGFVERRLPPHRLKEMWALYARWGIWVVMIPSILPPPTPFKIFVLSAGVFQLPFPKFLALVFMGRSIRYFMWGILGVLYGQSAKLFLQDHIRTVGITLFALLLGIIVTYFVVRRRTRKRALPQEAA